MGVVEVDRMGKIIGGVNPFEGTDVKLEDQPNHEDEEVRTDTVCATFCAAVRSHRVPFDMPSNDALFLHSTLREATSIMWQYSSS